jgi:hypothetical protein
MHGAGRSGYASSLLRGGGRPEATYLLEVVSGRPDLEPRLIELLRDQRQLVVAYSLLALENLNSPALEHLPQELLYAKRHVTWLYGSFGQKMELGAFVRHVQKRWRTKRSEGKPSG